METRITASLLKAVTGEFDLESIYKLSLCRMNIQRIEHLEDCENLVEANLTGNLIEHMTGLERCKRVRKLQLTSNKIRSLATLPMLVALEHLYLQDNAITHVEELNALPDKVPNLKTFYLKNIDGTQRNPVCDQPAYRSTIIRLLPDLFVLDGERVRHGDVYESAVDTSQKAVPKVDLPKPEPWHGAVGLTVWIVAAR